MVHGEKETDPRLSCYFIGHPKRGWGEQHTQPHICTCNSVPDSQQKGE